MADFNKLKGIPKLVKHEAIEPKEVITLDQINAMLKGKQKGAFDGQMYFLRDSGATMYTLMGYAGTGKTFTVVQLIKYLLSDKMGTISVAMTAPTNKAVGVMRRFMNSVDKRVHFATIHSMLGLREKINHRGEQVFERDYRVPVTINDHTVLFLDESSMLNDDLFHHILKEAYDVKVIFVGDPAQIPPIGKDNAIPMTEEGRAEYGIDSFMLDEIVRQKEGNPLIDVTLSIREDLETHNSIRMPEVKVTEEGGVEFISSYDQEAIGKLFEKYFNCESFRKDADHAKVIAWTNKTVDRLNDKIRNLIYGFDKVKVEIGEKMIANTPILDGEEQIIFNTSDEFEVDSLDIREAKVVGKVIKYYETKVKYFSYFSGQINKKTIHILHEDSEKLHKEVLAGMMRTAKGLTPGSEMARKAWVAFFQFKKVFADVKYAYAITAHKSQGSTYETVILMEGDINFNRKIVERNRIKYTAASRPSKKLYVIN